MGSNSDKNSVSEETSSVKPATQISRLPMHLFETTWRVAVPILVLTLGGHQLDQSNSSEVPVWTYVGLGLSLLFSTLLVYRYLKAHFPDAFKGEQNS